MKRTMPMPRFAMLLAAGFFLIPAASAATDKSGVIAGETWTPAMSPIRIVGDITVANLTIQPGVEVLFTGNFEFDCQGVIRAEGEEGNPVRFHGDTGVTWKGILFQNSSPGSILDWCVVENSNDHGVDIQDSFPAIRNCTFRNNISTARGGGLRAGVSVAGTLVVQGCSFDSNTAPMGGGASFFSNHADAIIHVSDSMFTNNLVEATNDTVRGGGASFDIQAGGYHILRCTFDNNIAYVIDTSTQIKHHALGGGLLLNAHAHGEVRNCIFTDNQATCQGDGNARGGGAILLGTASITLFNCYFNANSVTSGSLSQGAGIYTEGTGSRTCVNSTICNNNYQGVYTASQMTMINCIIYFNNSNGEQVAGGGPFTITYSDVQHSYAGTGNINVNPILDPVTYKISKFSSCVDAGDPDPAYDDLVFDPPVAWGSYGTARNDMGAHGGPGAALWEPGSFPLKVFPPSGGGIVGVGDTVTLQVSVGGIPPYTYLWKKGGVPLADIPGHLVGATTDTLTITNATSADDGEYTVDVTNAFGTITSSVTPIAIDPLRVNVKMFAGVIVQAAVGTTVRIEYSNDLSPGSWTTLTQFVLPTSPYTYYDTDSPNHPKRFYRATEIE